MDPASISELMTATGAQLAGTADDRLIVSRISIDSRTTAAGDLFWALCGARHDGHHFVDEAWNRGAAACVVRRGAAVSNRGPLLFVDDTMLALRDFARWHRHRCDALVIGVTGSVGKTTTREMLHAVLSASHVGYQSAKNFNNEVGLPLSLLELSRNDEFGVFEMGAARRGDIRALCEIATPEVGVLTRIGPAHLESFGSLDNIYLGKCELLEALPASGFGVVDGDDERMRALAARAVCRVIFFGEGETNHLRATNVSFTPGNLAFDADGTRFQVAAPARHYLTAALCALAVGLEIGMTRQAISEGFHRFRGQPGRCTVEQLSNVTIIDDAYNANPLSMQAACRLLQDWPAAQRKLLVLGDMLELGPASKQSHFQLGALAAASHVDRLLALGDNAESICTGAMSAGMKPHALAECRRLESLLAILDCWLEPGDVVLVKGSRGMHMERVVEWLKNKDLNARNQNFVSAAAA